MILAPIVVTVYHRPDCFVRCIESLLANELAKESELYVISDAAAKPEHGALVRQVRDYAKTIMGFKAVHLVFRETNLGSYLSGNRAIDEVLEPHDRFIFLEDDIVVAPGFLQYLNEGWSFIKRINGFLPFVHANRLCVSRMVTMRMFLWWRTSRLGALLCGAIGVDRLICTRIIERKN